MTGTTTTEDAVVVGWIGVGIMGEAMCTRLLNAGHSVVVWNRTEAKVSLRLAAATVAAAAGAQEGANRRCTALTPKTSQVLLFTLPPDNNTPTVRPARRAGR